MSGVGTELKRMLGKLGIEPTPQCDCEAHRIIMDEEGPDWCIQNMDLILGWMREEADHRKMMFSRTGAKLLVLLAVRRARKKQRILEH